MENIAFCDITLFVRLFVANVPQASPYRIDFNINTSKILLAGVHLRNLLNKNRAILYLRLKLFPSKISTAIHIILISAPHMCANLGRVFLDYLREKQP